MTLNIVFLRPQNWCRLNPITKAQLPPSSVFGHLPFRSFRPIWSKDSKNRLKISPLEAVAQFAWRRRGWESGYNASLDVHTNQAGGSCIDLWQRN